MYVLGQKSLVDCNSYISFNDRMVSNKRCQLDIFIILRTTNFELSEHKIGKAFHIFKGYLHF